MAPVVRRSWAPCAETPVLYQRTRRTEKVSAVAAISISPKFRRVGLYVGLLADRNVTTRRVLAFLRSLGRHLRGPLVLVWDRLPTHRARVVERFFQHRRRWHVVFLPPYAPELNPVEKAWAYLKHHALANFAAQTVAHLAHIARRHTRRMRRRPDLVRSFLYATPLFSRPN
jgi:transposase